VRHFVYEQLPGKVVFGQGSFARVPAELEAMGARRTVVLADALAKADADRLRERLADRLVGWIDEIRAHVPAVDVDAVRELVKATEADSLVTIGGGSTTGLGKAAVLEADLRFLAVPTTYAGSEMTPIYGITTDEVKQTGRDPRVKPHTVVYDVELTLQLAPEVTAGSTMNAMAHCVEALYAENRNPVVSIMALEGVRALQRGSTAVVTDGTDVDGRSELQYGAFLAGASLGAVGMAIHHRICHVLGGTFGVAHGDANAVILPYVAAYNAAAEPEAMERIAAALGASDAATGLRDLAERLGAPTSLTAVGLTDADIERAASMVVAGAAYNPRPVAEEWIGQLLEDALVGRPPAVGG
jgi:alcohol dehydrogenase class IV